MRKISQTVCGWQGADFAPLVQVVIPIFLTTSHNNLQVQSGDVPLGHFV